MSIQRPLRRAAAGPCIDATVLVLSACTTPRDGGAPVTVATDRPNVVSYWNEVTNRTVLATSATASTPEERTPAFFFDLGSMQVAYEQRVATLPEGPAKAMGLALGREVAAEVVRRRANNGRNVALAPYVSGSEPGRFRSASPNPVFRHFPSIRPFALESLGQFRPAPPPALDSAAYPGAVNETRALGGTTSTTRSAEQLEVARFHTEPPPAAITRNLGRFAASTTDVRDAARLMASLYVSYVDAIAACFEAKYHYEAWRPLSAIRMAEADSTDATAADVAWTPSLPTPNHPEYPAAHSCTSGSVGEVLRQFDGTPQVSFTWDSQVTGTTRRYDGIAAFSREAGLARIHGGMHFSHSIAAGEDLGRQVARWVTERHFGRQ